jgi:hypothetical protein
VSGRQCGLQRGERSDVMAFDYDLSAKPIQVPSKWFEGEQVFRDP